MTEAVVPRRCGAGAASRGGTGRPDSSPSEVRSARLLDGAAGGAGAPLRGIHQYDEIRNQFQEERELREDRPGNEDRSANRPQSAQIVLQSVIESRSKLGTE